MSTFQGQIAEDLGVFLNTDEFAEMHAINGTEMACTIDSDDLQKNSAVKIYSTDSSSGYKSHMLIFVRASTYGARPAIGSILTFDGMKKRITDVKEMNGVYTIEVEANRA